jgi:hypothetical protein
VWIEGGEHAFHRGINQIVVTRLVAVHVILPEQLDRFRENRNLRVAAVVIRAGGMGRVEPDSEEQVKKNKAREGAKQKAALHVRFAIRPDDDRSCGNFWQRANRPLRLPGGSSSPLLDVKSGGKAALFAIARGAADPPSVHEITLVYFQSRALSAALECAGGTEGLILPLANAVPLAHAFPLAEAVAIIVTQAITIAKAVALTVTKTVAIALLEA